MRARLPVLPAWRGRSTTTTTGAVRSRCKSSVAAAADGPPASSSSSPLPPAASPAPSRTPLPRTIASLLHAPDALPSTDGENPTVTIHGSIRSVRRMKNVSFASVSDGSTVVPLQAVLEKSLSAGLTTGSSVELTGEWKRSLAGTEQKNELLARHVNLLGRADPETYPLQKKYQTAEYLRSMPHLRSRIPHHAAVLQLRSFLTSSFTRFFDMHEFVQCYPPIITSSDCEGAGEVFSVSSASSETNNVHASPTHFFKSRKYLTVSTQLHLEALAAALPRVWTLSPTFRAEASDTNRHLSEFYMLEAEVSFINSLDPLTDMIEDMVRSVVSDLAESRVGREMLSVAGDEEQQVQLRGRWQGLIRPERWTRMSYTSAVEFLQKAVAEGRVSFKFAPDWGLSLQSEHEKFLASAMDGPVFVTDYPSNLKPFYMLPSAETDGHGPTVACFDLLLPSIGELVGGSLREHRHEQLIQNMKAHGLVSEGDVGDGGLSWYAELRKWGSQPHGGFGMGMERLICYLSGLDNIREASAFPRWAGRCDC